MAKTIAFNNPEFARRIVQTNRTFEDVLKWVHGVEERSTAGTATAQEKYLPELVIAFAKPQGTNNKNVVRAVEDKLTLHQWAVQPISISELLATASRLVQADTAGVAPGKEAGPHRTRRLMQWGDVFRRLTPWEMARFAVCTIAADRPTIQTEAIRVGHKGVAYLIKNLMHHSEVSFLRTIYKQRFFLVATYQPEDERLVLLTEELSLQGITAEEAEAEAKILLQIDVGDRPAAVPDVVPWDLGVSENSLNINETFHRADVFVAHDDFEPTITRWIQQMFGFPWGAPTLAELGMSTAYTAAHMSTAFGRPVGSAIVRGDSVIAMGWNDSAQPHGGVSRVDSDPNLQEHNLVPPIDPSDGNRLQTVKELLSRLFDPEWDELYDQEFGSSLPLPPPVQELREWISVMRDAAKKHGHPVTIDMVSAMAALTPLTTSRVFNLIEYGRAVHAEMAAITDAARRGVAVQGATMFVTTFPCHECARNIVAAGIEKLVFVEPYAKSMAETLYANSIQNRAKSSGIDPARIIFEPFVGISPSRFGELFSNVKRKYSLREAFEAGQGQAKVGQRFEWNPRSPELRTSVKGYLTDKHFEEFDYFERARRLAEESARVGLKRTLDANFPDLKSRLEGGA